MASPAATGFLEGEVTGACERFVGIMPQLLSPHGVPLQRGMSFRHQLRRFLNGLAAQSEGEALRMRHLGHRPPVKYFVKHAT